MLPASTPPSPSRTSLPLEDDLPFVPWIGPVARPATPSESVIKQILSLPLRLSPSHKGRVDMDAVGDEFGVDLLRIHRRPDPARLAVLEFPPGVEEMGGMADARPRPRGGLPRRFRPNGPWERSSPLDHLRNE